MSGGPSKRGRIPTIVAQEASSRSLGYVLPLGGGALGDQPTKTELLLAVRRFLDEELLPGLEGVQRFHARVASNALGIVVREIELERSHLRAQFARLVDLLGRTGEPPADPMRLDEEVTRMEAEVCSRIRDGAADDPDRRGALVHHLRETVRERLAVANPGYR